jgi:hypothetical protein
MNIPEEKFKQVPREVRNAIRNHVHNYSTVSDNKYDANTILKADIDNTPIALTIGSGTIVGRAAGGGIAALDNITRGYREGLNVTIKDATNLYVSGGVIEINGTVYEAESQLTIALGTIVANTKYYIYANAPATGTVLTATEFTVSTAVPVFSHTLGADYKTGDATKRLVARYGQGLTAEEFVEETEIIGNRGGGPLTSPSGGGGGGSPSISIPNIITQETTETTITEDECISLTGWTNTSYGGATVGVE